MKLLGAFLIALSFNATAQKKSETINVLHGDMETIVERDNAKTKKQTAIFTWSETVRGIRNVCVAYQSYYRTIYCRRNGRIYPCGQRRETRCVRYETREYTEVLNHKYGMKLKYTKSAREGYRGIEKYLVTFDKGSRCGMVSAANTRAEMRDIDNKSCLTAKIK